jgi:hypothetical protein
MDPVTVAAAVTPFLLTAVQGLGEKVWEKTSTAVADEAVGFGRRLLARLLGRGTGQTDATGAPDPGGTAAPGTRGEVAVVEAVNDLVCAPGDPDAAAALRLAVRKVLARDPSLMADVVDLLQTQAPHQHAGDRSIQIMGNQSGGVNITGDGNQVSW